MALTTIAFGRVTSQCWLTHPVLTRGRAGRGRHGLGREAGAMHVCMARVARMAVHGGTYVLAAANIRHLRYPARITIEAAAPTRRQQPAAQLPQALGPPP